MARTSKESVRFRLLALNGEHVAIVGDYKTREEAADVRREYERCLPYRNDGTWFDIVRLPDADAR